MLWECPTYIVRTISWTLERYKWSSASPTNLWSEAGAPQLTEGPADLKINEYCFKFLDLGVIIFFKVALFQ